MSDIDVDLTAWARDLGAKHDDIALVLRLLGSEGGDGGEVRVCLVMRDGPQEPWFAAGKGIDGMAYASVPGKDLAERFAAEPHLAPPGVRVYLNFCDARALMFTYDGGRERLAGDELAEFRYRILYPAGDRIPSLDEFFYLWGRPAET